MIGYLFFSNRLNVLFSYVREKKRNMIAYQSQIQFKFYCYGYNNFIIKRKFDHILRYRYSLSVIARSLLVGEKVHQVTSTLYFGLITIIIN